MEDSNLDITTYHLIHPDSIGFPSSHFESLILFREKIVFPSLQELSARIDALHQSNEVADEFLAEDYAGLHHKVVEGYLIAVQSMWERGLRSMLIRRDKKLFGGNQVNEIQKAVWDGNSKNPKGLQSLFCCLVGIPLQCFYSYKDLSLLQCLGNAIRHGDGPSANRLYELCPKLWCNWIDPRKDFFAGPFLIKKSTDVSTYPLFENVTLPEALLQQMIQSVLWFWEDMEGVRCNSFRCKSTSVERQLAEWSLSRGLRERSRLWSP